MQSEKHTRLAEGATNSVAGLSPPQIPSPKRQLTGITPNSPPENDAPDGLEDADQQFSGFQVAMLTFALSLGIFIITLDVTILATAIPTITADFQSLEEMGWYGSTYLLTQTAFQPTFGKIYDYFDTKWTILSGVVVFEVGSVVCATANSSKWLILGRAIAGMGASAMYSGGMNIVALMVPLSKRAPFLAGITSLAGVSNIAAPPLGGVLTDRLSWRWCFWINLPIGPVLFLIFLFYLKQEPRPLNMNLKERVSAVDPVGLVLLLSGLAALLLALGWGGITHRWSDPKVWGCLLTFGIILVLFCVLQWHRGDRATVPPRLLKMRTILGSSIFSCFLSLGFHVHGYYLPTYFQAVKGSSAEESGLQMLPYQISNTAANMAAGITIGICGWYLPFMWLGSIIFIAGSGLLYTLAVNTSTPALIGYQILAGVGLGASLNIPFIAAQVVSSKKDLSSANALMIFFHSVGGMIGLPIGQNIFMSSLRRALAYHAPLVNPTTIIDAGPANLRNIVANAELADVLKAYNASLTNAFISTLAAGSVAFLSSLLLDWRSTKERATQSATAA